MVNSCVTVGRDLWEGYEEVRIFMTKDPIVAEVRHYREKRAARFKFDVRAIARDAMKRERKSGRRTASLARARTGR